LSETIIKEKIPSEIENWGINKNSAIQLIKTKGHNNPFLGQIINGPLDSDKLDYLLRDAYHVGLKYSFDLDHFLRSYTVIGEEESLSTCILGLDSTKRAVVTAELFIVIWKSMYDLVYLVEQSRISEKMLEKAFLIHENEYSVKKMFEIENFVKGNDESMLSQLKEMEDVDHLLAPENPKRLYSVILDKELNKKNYRMTAKFLAKVEDDPDELADQLSIRLSEELKQPKYSIICDVVKSRAPRDIYLESEDSEQEEVLLRNKSDIVGVIKAKNALKVYAQPTLLKKIDNKHIQESLKSLVEGEVEGD
jgi:HD superfamily phosphohydrolase